MKMDPNRQRLLFVTFITLCESIHLLYVTLPLSFLDVHLTCFQVCVMCTSVPSFSLAFAALMNTNNEREKED